MLFTNACCVKRQHKTRSIDPQVRVCVRVCACMCVFVWGVLMGLLVVCLGRLLVFDLSFLLSVPMLPPLSYAARTSLEGLQSLSPSTDKTPFTLPQLLITCPALLLCWLPARICCSSFFVSCLSLERGKQNWTLPVCIHKENANSPSDRVSVLGCLEITFWHSLIVALVQNVNTKSKWPLCWDIL